MADKVNFALIRYFDDESTNIKTHVVPVGKIKDFAKLEKYDDHPFFVWRYDSKKEEETLFAAQVLEIGETEDEVVQKSKTKRHSFKRKRYSDVVQMILDREITATEEEKDDLKINLKNKKKSKSTKKGAISKKKSTELEKAIDSDDFKIPETKKKKLSRNPKPVDESELKKIMDEKLSTLNSQSLIFGNDNDVEKLEKDQFCNREDSNVKERKDHLLNENEIYKSDFLAKLIEQNKLLMQENTSLKQAFGNSHTNKELLCKEQNVDCPLPATTMSKKSQIDSNVEFLAWNKDDFINSGIPRTSPVNSYDENFGDLDALLPLGTSSPNQCTEIDSKPSSNEKEITTIKTKNAGSSVRKQLFIAECERPLPADTNFEKRRKIVHSNINENFSEESSKRTDDPTEQLIDKVNRFLSGSSKSTDFKKSLQPGMPPEKLFSQPGMPTENQVSNTNVPEDYLKCEDKQKKKKKRKNKSKKNKKAKGKKKSKKDKKNKRKQMNAIEENEQKYGNLATHPNMSTWYPENEKSGEKTKMHHLFYGVSIHYAAWKEARDSKSASKFIRNASRSMWTTYVLMNRAIDVEACKANRLPNRSPRKPCSPVKTACLERAYYNYVNNNCTGKTKKDEKNKWKYHLGVYINYLISTELKRIKEEEMKKEDSNSDSSSSTSSSSSSSSSSDDPDDSDD